MADLLIRKIDDEVKASLQRRAKRNGVSMEAEARSILRAAVMEEDGKHVGLGTQIANLFKDIDWGDEQLPSMPRTHFKPISFEK